VSPDPATTSPCAKCGVAVPLGYVKCPRCHAPMPATQPLAARAKRNTMRDAVAGGTAVPEPESGGFPWLLAGVCAAAAIAAIVWYVQSGGARAADAPVPADQVDLAAMVAPGSAAGSSSREPEPPPAPVVDPRPRQRLEALATLEHTLASDKLWATVTAGGDNIEIRSSFCADRGVAARVTAAHDALASLGFKAVRCLEKAGAPVWALDL